MHDTHNLCPGKCCFLFPEPYILSVSLQLIFMMPTVAEDYVLLAVVIMGVGGKDIKARGLLPRMS
jgi:hypothetical protein